MSLPLHSPLVISASRATDIPAFHGEWFMARLRAGFCRRRNPFNSRQESLISFARTRVFVFWSKHPSPFLPHLAEIAATGRQFYFQYTLNTYEAEGLEPGLPSLCHRLETFKRLADTIGPQRVIWRCDPLIVGGGLSTDTLLERIDRLGRELSPYTEKLVFSFVDMYRKTAAALRRLDPAYRAPTVDEMRELARGIASLNAGWPHRLELATCAEGIDLSALGIHKNKCIDDVLIRRLCPQDALVQAELAPRRQLSLLPGMETAASASKDTGQRTACGGLHDITGEALEQLLRHGDAAGLLGIGIALGAEVKDSLAVGQGLQQRTQQAAGRLVHGYQQLALFQQGVQRGLGQARFALGKDIITELGAQPRGPFFTVLLRHGAVGGADLHTDGKFTVPFQQTQAGAAVIPDAPQHRGYLRARRPENTQDFQLSVDHGGTFLVLNCLPPWGEGVCGPARRRMRGACGVIARIWDSMARLSQLSVHGTIWQGCPSSVACGDSFPLRGSLFNKNSPAPRGTGAEI